MPSRKAVVLLSGGLDSATCLAIAKSQGFELYALTMRYGQRHQTEIHSATAIVERTGVAEHRIIDIDLRQFGGSALTADIPVPHDRALDEMDSGIPITYVPARNTVFLTYALAWAEVLDAFDIFIGVNAVDYSGYPDCRPEFIAAFESMANLATRHTVESDQRLTVHTPLIDLTKAEIIAQGMQLGVDYGLSSTCYSPAADGTACGHCDACLLRLKGFEEAGLTDPVPYQ
jgi:7-cyano-7-deazaguanine synthase